MKTVPITIILIIFCFFSGLSQTLLGKNISIEATQRPLSEVLNEIGKQGGFYFSYNSNIINNNQLVSLSVRNKSVKEALETLFNNNYQYKEKDGYVIIKKGHKEKTYTISGHVIDYQTGELVANASIYDRGQLTSTLSNRQGHFKLKLKDKALSTTITVSKEWYNDTSVIIKAQKNEDINLVIKPVPAVVLAEVLVVSTANVETTWLANAFLSSKQKIQTLNVKQFFTSRPYQFSILPGIGTHGKMNSQIENRFSLNLFGGYSAAINGAEIGGLFNITKKDVKYAQFAGIFNTAGENVKGAQIAGIHNYIIDSLEGVQIAGFSNILKGSVSGAQIAGCVNKVNHNIKGAQLAGGTNYTKGNIKGVQIAGCSNKTLKGIYGAQIAGLSNQLEDSLRGIQIAGVLNIIKKNMRGAQAAGVGNIADSTTNGIQVGGVFNLSEEHTGIQMAGIVNAVKEKTDGTQIAGIANFSRKEVDGIQIAGIFNYSKKLKGVQIGLINIADSCTGYTIGLVNINRKGYHKLSVYANEITNLNIAYKSGNRKIYSILLSGFNISKNAQAFTFGYGLGNEIQLSKKIIFSTELTSQCIYMGNWEDLPFFYRIQPLITFNISEKFSLSAGPSFSICFSEQKEKKDGFKLSPPGDSYPVTFWNDTISSWFGLQVGLSFF